MTAREQRNDEPRDRAILADDGLADLHPHPGELLTESLGSSRSIKNRGVGG